MKRWQLFLIFSFLLEVPLNLALQQQQEQEQHHHHHQHQQEQQKQQIQQEELLLTSKVPNKFFYNVEWTKELCHLAVTETRLVPPRNCLESLNQRENASFNDIEEWEKKHELTSPNILVTGTPRSGTTMFAALATALGIVLSNDAHPPTALGTVSWAFAGPTTHYPLCPQQKAANKRRSLNSIPPPGHERVKEIDVAEIVKQSQIQRKPSPKQHPIVKIHPGKKNLAPKIAWVPHPRYRFHHIFHQVRDPLSSIPSLTTVVPHWFKCKSEILPITPAMDYEASVAHMALQIWVEWNRRLDRYPFIPVYRVEDFNLLDLLASANHSHSIKENDFQCVYHHLRGHNTRSTDKSKQQDFIWANVFGINQTLGRIALDMAYRYGYRYYRDSTLVPMTPSKSRHIDRVSAPPTPLSRNETGLGMNATLRSTKIKPNIPITPLCQKFTTTTLRSKKPPKSLQIQEIKYPSLSEEEMAEIFTHPIFVKSK